jgi:hypothetical protein
MVDHDPDAEMFIISDDIAEAESKRLGPKLRNGVTPTGPAEETFYFRYGQSDDGPKYTETEQEAFREGCLRVIVHDYGPNDFYHTSDEDREQHDQLAAFNTRLGALKRIYRSVDKYIEAMRTVYEAWSALADSSVVHTREEFFRLVGEGLIISNRIIAPKLKGIDNYNQELILEYINNPALDPTDLVPKVREEADNLYYQDEGDRQAEMDRLLDDEEIEYILLHDQRLKDRTALTIESQSLKPRQLKSYDDELHYRKGNKKKGNKGSKKRKPGYKSQKRFDRGVNEMLKRIQMNNYNKDHYGYSFGVMENLFAEDDQPHLYDDARYEGSWLNDEHLALYELAMEEARLAEKLPHDNLLTHGDYEMQNFYRILEKNGVSTIELRRLVGGDEEDYITKRKRESRKLNKKLESAIIQRIQVLSKDEKFQKLVKKSEKALAEYRKEKKLTHED